MRVISLNTQSECALNRAADDSTVAAATGNGLHIRTTR